AALARTPLKAGKVFYIDDILAVVAHNDVKAIEVYSKGVAAEGRDLFHLRRKLERFAELVFERPRRPHSPDTKELIANPIDLVIPTFGLMISLREHKILFGT